MKSELEVRRALEVLRRQAEALLEAMANGRPAILVTTRVTVVSLIGFGEWVLETGNEDDQQFGNMIEGTRQDLQRDAERN